MSDKKSGKNIYSFGEKARMWEAIEAGTRKRKFKEGGESEKVIKARKQKKKLPRHAKKKYLKKQSVREVREWEKEGLSVWKKNFPNIAPNQALNKFNNTYKDQSLVLKAKDPKTGRHRDTNGRFIASKDAPGADPVAILPMGRRLIQLLEKLHKHLNPDGRPRTLEQSGLKVAYTNERSRLTKVES